jgi:hypothetical protein
MALVNGVTPSLPNSTPSLPNTGKRKRSDSLDPQNHTNNQVANLEQQDGFQQSLKDILQILRKWVPAYAHIIPNQLTLFS